MPEQAESEATMIEIIQEENWDSSQERSGLPKNIKQIGTPDIGDRIYIENLVYQKMHANEQKREKMVYVMLGHFDDFAGYTCIFVEDAVEMREVEFSGKLPVWNDDSWGYLYRKIRPEHENMIIVGWAVDIRGQLPGMTAQLERVHQTYFGGIHQILLLMDTLEQEEAFFSNRNGYLKRREGFYVYYDKEIPRRMENAMENLREENQRGKNHSEEKIEAKKEEREERYRDYLNERRMPRTAPKSAYKNSYSPTLLLLAVIVALGYSAFQNHQKMASMEKTLNQIELQAVMQTETDQQNAVRVEEVMGNITASQNQETSQQPDTQTTAATENQAAASTEESTPIQPDMQQTETSAQPMSEAELYLTQGYYIVQQGDSLANICRKIYHTTAMMEKLCEINKIDDPNAIFVGQRLTLPD